MSQLSVLLLSLQQMCVEKLLRGNADFQMVGVGTGRCDDGRGGLGKWATGGSGQVMGRGKK